MPTLPLAAVMMLVAIVGVSALTFLVETVLNYKLPGPTWKRMVHNLIWELSGMIIMLAFMKYGHP